jgi:PAS domain-containing protein
MEGMADPDRAAAQARPDAPELLGAVVSAARRLLASPDVAEAISAALEEIGRASASGRVTLVEAASWSDGTSGRTATWSSSTAGGADDDAAETESFSVEVLGLPWGRLEVRRPGTAWNAAERDALAAAAGLIGDAIGRERRDRTVEESRDRYRRLIEQIPAATYVDVEGPDGTAWPTVYVSPQIEELLGYSTEEWRADATLWAKLVHPEDRETAFVADREHYENGSPLHSE